MLRLFFSLMLVYSCLPKTLRFQNFAEAHIYHVDHTDEEIDAMDMPKLIHVERDLRSQNALVAQHISSNGEELAELKNEHRKLEKRAESVEHAKDWETQQKQVRQRDLEKARAELDAKKMQVKMLAVEAQKLQETIREMKLKMQSLDIDKQKLREEYMHPSLDEVLVHKTEQMGPLSQHLLNKTMKSVAPGIEDGLREAAEVQNKFSQGSTAIALFTSLCVYVLALSVLYIAYSVIGSLRTLLTMTRLLFTVDMAFALTWLFVCILYMVLGADPIQIMAVRHEGLTVIFQIVLMCTLIGNIILRCIPLSLNFRTLPFLELLCAVYIAQHYYQSIWHPCLMDEPLKTSFFTFAMYFSVSSSLAVYRARTVRRGIEGFQEFYQRESNGLVSSQRWLKARIESTLNYWERIMSRSSLATEDHAEVGPAFYRKTRHPETLGGKRKSPVGRTLARQQRGRGGFRR